MKRLPELKTAATSSLQVPEDREVEWQHSQLLSLAIRGTLDADGTRRLDQFIWTSTACYPSPLSLFLRTESWAPPHTERMRALFDRYVAAGLVVPNEAVYVKGADGSRLGFVPLERAVMTKNAPLIAALLDHGADKLMPAGSGSLPRELAGEPIELVDFIEIVYRNDLTSSGKELQAQVTAKLMEMRLAQVSPTAPRRVRTARAV